MESFMNTVISLVMICLLVQYYHFTSLLASTVSCKHISPLRCLASLHS